MYQKHYLQNKQHYNATLCHPQPAGLSLRSGDQGFPLTHSTISMTPGFYFHSRKR